jgi:hypothetical protein
MRRCWRDREGDLLVETSVPGQVVLIDSQVIGRVAEKFGTFPLPEATEDFGPLSELEEAHFTPLDDTAPTLRERLRASRLHRWWMHPYLWEWPWRS